MNELRNIKHMKDNIKTEKRLKNLKEIDEIHGVEIWSISLTQ